MAQAQAQDLAMAMALALALAMAMAMAETTYLPLDEYRYRSMLEHLAWLGKRQGWREYAEHKARQYSRHINAKR
jgi:hypothetical protein